MSKTINISEVKVGERARVDLGDLDELTFSIGHLGLLQPIVVTTDERLIAGHRRLEACRRLGMDEVQAVVAEHITDAVDLLKAERDENTCRKPMAASELIALGRQIEALEKPVGADRIRRAQAARRASKSNFVPANEVSEPESRDRHDSREKAAEAVGLSTATYSRIKQIANAAEGHEESRGHRTEVEPERQAQAAEALQVIDRITSGEEVRPVANARPLTVTAVYEEWKGHKVNRGDDAPTERRRPAPDSTAVDVLGRRISQRSHQQSLAEAIATLSGLCVGFARITALDDSIGAEEAARWARDLDRALQVQRSLRTKLKEYSNGND